MDPILEEVLEGEVTGLNLMMVALSPRFSLSSEPRRTHVAAGSDETAAWRRETTITLSQSHDLITVACFRGQTGNAELVFHCSLTYSDWNHCAANPDGEGEVLA